ncbi:MAG: acyl--CoA ligase [Lachnospiraceae bacterium]|nr:acyl--CoA ligase [Lachnospiraceae bacterium]
MKTLLEENIIDVIKKLDENNKFKKDIINESDKLYDISLIIKTLNENGLISGYPHIDKIHRIYYLYEMIVLNRKQNKTLNPKQSAYDYFMKITDGYNGTALTIDCEISYNQFKESIEKEAYVNDLLGISSSDRITFLLPSMPSTYSDFYALSKINAGRNIVDLRTSPEGIKKYINETESKYLFCMETVNPKLIKEIMNETSVKKIKLFTPPFYELKNSIKKNIGKTLIWANEIGYKKLGDSIFLPKDLEKMKSNYKNVEGTKYDDDKPTLFLHTSGTFGFPKTVMANDKCINIVANQYRKSLMDLKSGYRSLGIMPPWIFYGIMGFHMPFALNMNVYPIADASNAKFDDIILSIKPNTIAGVPNHWISLMSSKKVPKDFNLDFLKTPACGGDGISKTNNDKLNKYLSEHGSKTNLGAGYALSENTSIATANQGIYNKSGTVGINFLDMNCAIVNPNTLKPLKYNEIGVVCVNGDLMIGYLNNPKETQDAFIEINGEKYVYTGDIGYIDEEGYLTIINREKNLIVRNDGFKISPLEIENVILKHSSVKNCVVFGIRDIKFEQGYLPAVRIEFNDEKLTSNEKKVYIKEIKKMCEENLSSYYLPEVYYVDTIPLTKMGKFDRAKMLEDYETYKKNKKGKNKIYHK